MTTPKPLPADIKDALYGYANSVVDSVRDMTEAAQAVEDAALEKLTTLLSGYIEKAAKWDEQQESMAIEHVQALAAAPVEPEREGLTPEDDEKFSQLYYEMMEMLTRFRQKKP